jgi:hypothetical protein
MLASKIIKQLQEQIELCGDLPVCINARITTGKKPKQKEHWNLIDAGNVYSLKDEITVIDALD